MSDYLTELSKRAGRRMKTASPTVLANGDLADQPFNEIYARLMSARLPSFTGANSGASAPAGSGGGVLSQELENELLDKAPADMFPSPGLPWSDPAGVTGKETAGNPDVPIWSDVWRNLWTEDRPTEDQIMNPNDPNSWFSKNMMAMGDNGQRIPLEQASQGSKGEQWEAMKHKFNIGQTPVTGLRARWYSQMKPALSNASRMLDNPYRFKPQGNYFDKYHRSSLPAPTANEMSGAGLSQEHINTVNKYRGPTPKPAAPAAPAPMAAPKPPTVPSLKTSSIKVGEVFEKEAIQLPAWLTNLFRLGKPAAGTKPSWLSSASQYLSDAAEQYPRSAVAAKGLGIGLGAGVPTLWAANKGMAAMGGPSFHFGGGSPAIQDVPQSLYDSLPASMRRGLSVKTGSVKVGEVFEKAAIPYLAPLVSAMARGGGAAATAAQAAKPSWLSSVGRTLAPLPGLVGKAFKTPLRTGLTGSVLGGSLLTGNEGFAALGLPHFNLGKGDLWDPKMHAMSTDSDLLGLPRSILARMGTPIQTGMGMLGKNEEPTAADMFKLKTPTDFSKFKDWSIGGDGKWTAQGGGEMTGNLHPAILMRMKRLARDQRALRETGIPSSAFSGLAGDPTDAKNPAADATDDSPFKKFPNIAKHIPY